MMSNWPARGEIGIDYGHGTSIQVIRCGQCGWEGNTVEQLVPHLQSHGVTRVTVTPENYRRR